VVCVCVCVCVVCGVCMVCGVCVCVCGVCVCVCVCLGMKRDFLKTTKSTLQLHSAVRNSARNV
jgi:hypothetical protein